MVKYPTYVEVREALEQIHALGEAPETHGMLCALFSSGAGLRQQAWVDSLLAQFVQSDDSKGNNAQKILQKLYDATSNSFAEKQFNLQLLLPDDDVDLHERVEALRQWCQGFISGMKLVGIDIDAQTESDLKEAIADLINISCLDFKDSELADEAAEEAYIELVEYARIAAMLLHTEQEKLNRLKVEMPGNDTKH